MLHQFWPVPLPVFPVFRCGFSPRSGHVACNLNLPQRCLWWFSVGTNVVSMRGRLRAAERNTSTGAASRGQLVPTELEILGDFSAKNARLEDHRSSQVQWLIAWAGWILLASCWAKMGITRPEWGEYVPTLCVQNGYLMKGMGTHVW